jgi:hypothetical protein
VQWVFSWDKKTLLAFGGQGFEGRIW